MTGDLNAYGWLSALLDHAGSRPAGGKLRQCPAHPDAAPSLSLAEGRDGRMLWRCHAGCDPAVILAALRCAPARLFRPPPVDPATYAEMVGLRVDFPPVVLRHGHPASRGYRLTAVHDYGRAVLERWRDRAGHKELTWSTRLGDGTTAPGLIGITLADLPLYRETEVRQAVAVGDAVLVVESESSVDALRAWYATTWPGGAGAVNLVRLGSVLGGHPRVVLVPDHDAAGLRAADRISRALHPTPATVLPAPGEDARDLYARLGPDWFRQAVASSTRTGVVA